MKFTYENEDGTLTTVETNCVKLMSDNLTMQVIERVSKQEMKLPSGKTLYIGKLWPHHDDKLNRSDYMPEEGGRDV